MEISLSLCLPRDALSVPVVRKVAVQALDSVGFIRDDIGDVELAITEACSNVLRHSELGDEYEVRMHLTDATLVMEVVDAGRGFDGASLGHAHSPGDAETGRGIQLMRAMVDDVRFSYLPGRGSVVSMSKTLRYDESSPVSVLLRRTPPARSS